MAEAKKDKWAGWPNGKLPKKQETKASNSKVENTPHLLLSEQVLELFRKIEVGDRSLVGPDGTVVVRDGNLKGSERAYLASLLADSATAVVAGPVRKDLSGVICCAEFYAELMPVESHGRVSERVLRDGLTLAIRRCPSAGQLRHDNRAESFIHKIPPPSASEKPTPADPFTLAEIFAIIILLCERDDVQKRMEQIQKRNLVLLTITLCKQGSINRKVAGDKFKLIKEELKIVDAELKADELYQLWDSYCKFVVEPPCDVPMLDDSVTSGDKPKMAGSKEESAAEDHERGDCESARKAADDDVANLTEWLQDIRISNEESPWGYLFKRIEKKCRGSKTLSTFVRQAEGGSMTVAIQFREAYKQFPDFDWLMAFHEFPDEQVKLWEALDQLAKDPFCAFAKANPHPHSSYLHLGYLGISLMEKVGGRTTLANYMGFQKYRNEMTKKQDIDRWVSVYASSLNDYYYDTGYYDGGGYNGEVYGAGGGGYGEVYDAGGNGGGGYGNYYEPSSPVYHDPTLKYASFKIPNGKGTDDQSYYGSHGYDGYQGYDHHGGCQGYGYDCYQKGANGGRGKKNKSKTKGPSEYRGGYGPGPYSDGAYSAGLGGDYDASFDPSGPSMDYYRGLRDGYMTAFRGRPIRGDNNRGKKWQK